MLDSLIDSSTPCPRCAGASKHWSRGALASLLPAHGTRIIWQLVRKDERIGTVAECANSPSEPALDDRGALQPGATPVTEVAWLFEIEIETNTEAHMRQAQERATKTLSCHVLFSRRCRQAVEFARSRLDLVHEASLAKQCYSVSARGTARVRAFA